MLLFREFCNKSLIFADMGIAENILFQTLCLTAFGTLLCALLLYMRRAFGDRSRRLLGWCFAFCGVVVAVRAWMGSAGWPVAGEVLLSSDLDSGLLTLFVFFLYPIEVIHPGWLNARRIALIALPWIAFSLLWAFIPFRQLSSFSEMTTYAGEFNVWIRGVFLAMFVPLCFVLLYIPRNWRKSSADNRWISLYTVGTQGIAVLYLLSMLTGDTLVNAVHIAYCMGFCFVVTYQELFLRMRVPVEREELPQAVPAAAETPAGPPCPAEPSPLWDALMHVMDEEELWRNPDLSLETLAARLASNRTTLAQTIRRHGYEDYRHFINRRRIGEFLKIARTDPRISIQDTFFRVGFRSKITALRYFRRETGTTPSDYVRRLSKRG